MVGAPVRRRQIAYANQRGLSVRRACALMSVARSTLHYESRLIKRDAPAVAVMRELAAQYPRYGYRRIQVLLERQWTPHERRPSSPPVAPVWAAGAAQTATATDCQRPPAPVAGNGRGISVGIRFCIRCLRERATAEVFDGDR